LTPQEIQEKLIGLEKETRRFKEDLFRISWYMRGGVTVNDLLTIYSAEDREFMYNIINDNIEATKVSQMPLI
jgi:hypothetical protein